MLVKVCKKARKYFSDAITDHVLSMVKTDIDPLRRDRMSRALCLITLFVPFKDSTFQTLLPLLRSGSPLWAANCKRFEGMMFYLLARSAKHCSCPDLSTDLPFYYCILIRHLKVPTPENSALKPEKILYHTKTAVNIVKGQLNSPVGSFAKFLAYSCSRDPVLLDGLAGFLASIDSFCHPANNGRWAKEILELLSEMIQYLTRIFSSRKGVLPESTLAQLVSMLWQPISKLVFSKNPAIASQAQGTVKFLSFLCPHYIRHQVMELGMVSLSSHCEVKS